MPLIRSPQSGSSTPRRRAAIALAHRLGRLDDAARKTAVREFDMLYEQLDRLDVDDELVRRAGVLAEEQRLRGYDAVHLAAAERVAGPETVLVAGDADLCRAAHALQLHVTQLATSRV